MCARAWASAYTNCAEEGDGYWLPVEGRLPRDLEGTLYRSCSSAKAPGSGTVLCSLAPASCTELVSVRGRGVNHGRCALPS